MRDLPVALASHLAGGVTTLCQCWRLTRRDGAVLGFTDHDRDLVFDGVTHAAAAGLAPTEAEAELGMAVATGEVSGALTGAALTEADIAAGLYDDASVSAYLVNWADPSQRLLLDVASIGEIRRSGATFVAEMRGAMHRYDQEQGRLYQSACSADLGDARCGLALGGFTHVAGVGTTDGRLALVAPAVAALPAGYFTGGRVTFTSGANAGQSRMIRSHQAGGAITLWEPLIGALAEGDGLSLVAGCDRQFETCRSKFANTLNFRGFPHIPTPDFILTYARSGEGGHDGGLIDP